MPPVDVSWLVRLRWAAALLFLLSSIGTSIPRSLALFIAFRLLAGVGIGVTIVSLMVEPATTRAAFPRRLSGSGRRTPVRKR